MKFFASFLHSKWSDASPPASLEISMSTSSLLGSKKYYLFIRFQLHSHNWIIGSCFIIVLILYLTAKATGNQRRSRNEGRPSSGGREAQRIPHQPMKANRRRSRKNLKNTQVLMRKYIHYFVLLTRRICQSNLISEWINNQIQTVIFCCENLILFQRTNFNKISVHRWRVRGLQYSEKTCSEATNGRRADGHVSGWSWEF